MIFMRKIIYTVLLFLIQSALLYAEGNAEFTLSQNWPVYRGDRQLSGTTSISVSPPLTLENRFQLPSGITASPVGAEGRLFTGTLDGILYAMDIISGEILWQYDTKDSIEAASTVILSEKLVISGTLEGIIYANDMYSGELKWKYATDGQIMGSANYYTSPDSNKTIAVIGSYDNSLYFLEAATGTLISKYKTDNFINSTPAFSNSRVVFGGCDALLHILDTGSMKETGAVNTKAYIAGSACFSESIAFTGNYSGFFSAIDTAANKTLWEYTLPEDDSGFIASPAVSGKNIIIGSKGGRLLNLDKDTGNIIWQYNAGDGFESSAVITPGHVIAVTSDGMLIILRLEDGKRVWSYDLGTSVKSSPAIAGFRLIITGIDGSVFVFGL